MSLSVFKTKTAWTGIAAIIAAVGSYVTGELELAQAVQMALTGLIGVFLRDGMLKK